jgi:hypothetical protein
MAAYDLREAVNRSAAEVPPEGDERRRSMMDSQLINSILTASTPRPSSVSCTEAV